MQQWEYLSIFIEADAEREQEFLKHYSSWKEGIPKHTPEAMIPRLNTLGEQGWELIHMQPVAAGQNSDVLMHDSSSTRFWTKRYFCVFKRPKGE